MVAIATHAMVTNLASALVVSFRQHVLDPLRFIALASCVTHTVARPHESYPVRFPFLSMSRPTTRAQSLRRRRRGVWHMYNIACIILAIRCRQGIARSPCHRTAGLRERISLRHPPERKSEVSWCNDNAKCDE